MHSVLSHSVALFNKLTFCPVFTRVGLKNQSGEGVLLQSKYLCRRGLVKRQSKFCSNCLGTYGPAADIRKRPLSGEGATVPIQYES